MRDSDLQARRIKCDMQNDKRRTAVEGEGGGGREREREGTNGISEGPQGDESERKSGDEGKSRSHIGAYMRAGQGRPRKRQTDGFTYL